MNLNEIIRYLQNYSGKAIKIMEVCGTHTSSIFKNGIRTLISPNIKLVSGPGCPVCVTPPSVIDALIEYAKEAEVLSFGDMFRVPGSHLSLADAKARGAKVRLMYSPFEVIALAKEYPEIRFVVAAVGFETTAPVYAALIQSLIVENIQNVTLCTALKTMPEVLDYICVSEEIDAFLCPGHVSAIIGSAAYEPLCKKYKKPFVIAGFEAEHILTAVYEIVRQIEIVRHEVKNLYPSVVTEGGQTKALELLDRYFVKINSFWRGIGEIKNSGYALKSEYARFSADSLIDESPANESLPDGCRCADVMLGRNSPDECALFGTVCTPQNPVGACMVSSEGACGIWKRGS
ncbi:MAG: hydrogenase formation protein HypD [Oscillospiraceae bacterium]|nr:hydrogenase formation protein HypD [Oscillospiraceae bacterium]